MMQYRPPSKFDWTRQAPNTTGYVAYKTVTNTVQCTLSDLDAGSYKINITNSFSSAKTVSCNVDTVKNDNGTYTVTVTSPGMSPNVYPNNTEPKGTFSVTADPASCEFKWYKFDYTANPPKFSTSAFKTQQGTVTSADNLDEGGYKVSVKSMTNASAPRDSFVAWLYMNPGFDLKLYKDDNGNVIYAYKYCDHTDFPINPTTPVVQSSFTYYNPLNSQTKLTMENEIAFTISRGGGAKESIKLQKQGGQQYFREYYPPYRDTKYAFEGRDMFGVVRGDDIMYESIVPYADMDALLPEVDPSSAPVEVRFTNRSINATEYLWRFGDGDSAVYDLEHLSPDTVKHTYYKPKKYTAVLLVTNQYGCTSTSNPKEIVVDPSSVKTVNVFTPNNDGINDYFKPENVSIQQFEISIYTRAGKRVYHYKGDDLRSWEGWNGRIDNTGNEAAEGVYFYIIKAVGWDDKKYDKGTGTFGGSLHLYR